MKSSEYKSLNSKIKGWQEDVARIKRSLAMMDSINHKPLKQERDSILRAVKDVAKNAKKFNDNSNGQKYCHYRFANVEEREFFKVLSSAFSFMYETYKA